MSMSVLWTLTVTLLTLLALLAARGDGTDQCQHRPTITGNYKQDLRERDEGSISYGEDITLFCSSCNDSSLTISAWTRPRVPGQDKQLQVNRFNSTTIQVTVFKPDVEEFVFCCEDSVTLLKTYKIIDVLPAIVVSVPSQRVIHALNEYGTSIYLIPPGEVCHVFCSANLFKKPYVPLFGSRRIGRTETNVDTAFYSLQTTAVNETTVMGTVTNVTEWDRFQRWSLSCTPVRLTLLSGEVIMLQDYYPEAKDFKCVIYYPQYELECWWQYLSNRNSFKLFIQLHTYYDEQQGGTPICASILSRTTAGCKSLLPERAFDFSERYSIHLQTCYESIFCNNQTFNVLAEEILRVAPVHDLRLTNTSSRSAVVAWRQKCKYNCCVYKAEYRMLGKEWRSANMSATKRCLYRSLCEVELALPCPDAHYEFRLYAKQEKAIDDILHWSEPSLLFFFTSPNTGGEVDPSCAADLREVTEKPQPSATDLLYEVKQLISDERKVGNEIRKYVTDMHKKIDQIRTLMHNETHSLL